MNVSNSTCVESSNSVRRSKSKDTKSKDKVLKNTNDKRPFAHVQKIDSKVKRALFTAPIAAKSKNLGAASVVAKSRLSVAKTPTTTNKYPVIHQHRQEMSTEILLAKEKLIKAIRTCLNNNNQPPEEKSIAILLAEESILTVMQTLEEKQIDTESVQELLLQLSKDLQTLGNTSNQLKQEEQDSSQYWKPPVYYFDDDDDFYRESIDETPPSDAIAPDLPIMDSLVMKDEHLDTIPERIQTKKLKHFKIYSNPLLEFDEEIFSSEINLLYNEVLEDLNPILPGNENDQFNAESDLIESLLNKNTVITSPKIDFLLEEFTDIRLIKKLLYDNSSPRPPEELNSENDFENENCSSTTIHTDISLPEYESFYNESDYASEIFNDDLTHIISPSEYEYVYVVDESDSGDLTTKVVDDI
nr:hypothetical protein [Tanacetum cinerariifolium]